MYTHCFVEIWPVPRNDNTKLSLENMVKTSIKRHIIYPTYVHIYSSLSSPYVTYYTRVTSVTDQRKIELPGYTTMAGSQTTFEQLRMCGECQ